MAGTVFVIVEHWRGKVTQISYELLALGREVADQLLAPLQAVLLGHDAKELIAALGIADSVLYLDHPQLKEPVPETYAAALAELIRQRRPRCILCPLTNISLGIEALLAEYLGAPCVSMCKDLRVAARGYEATCLLYGGKIEAVVSVEASPAVFGVRSGARPAYRGRVERRPPVEEVAVSLPDAPPVRLNGYLKPQGGDVDITQQELLVAVGRGIQSPDNLALARNLANSLGAVVCGSRPTVDCGWLPLSRQVGCAGLTVKPKLYLALGISGAPEHVEGMRDSGVIVAVNTDPRAPIFDIAHYGIAVDALEFVPVLTRVVESGKGAG